MTKSPTFKKEEGSPMSINETNGHDGSDCKATPSTDHVITSLSKTTLSSGTSLTSDLSAPSTTTATPETISSTMPDTADEKPVKAENTDKQSGGPQLFLDYPSATEEATSTFGVIGTCTYTPMKLGNTDQEEPMACDCGADTATGVNMACMPGSDCINVNTSMECTGGHSCGCGTDCRNQRFQKREWAEVTVIKTEKKGYGLRADKYLDPDTFIFEYVGEVIDEARFQKRRMEYDKEGIKHFYFMSLAKNQFIDATKKGNLARFCNHSCNPNCYVEKWIVGNKFRMGIFAKRAIQEGEELTFDYNVDRYGSEAQKCWCGEPNCIGYIGGKTQTDGKQTSTRKISDQVSEALGLEISKRGRKTVGVDEEFLRYYEPRPLDAESSLSVIMGVLLSNEEDYIVAKVLQRLRSCEDRNIHLSVMRLHGYQIMNGLLKKWVEKREILENILNILLIWPNETKNKITASKIEGTIQELTEHEIAEVSNRAVELLEVWSKLKTGYRIPRRIRTEGDDEDSKSPSKGPGDSSTGNNSPAPSTPAPPPSSTVPPFRRVQPKAFVPGAPKGPKIQMQQEEESSKSLPHGWLIHYANGRRCYQSTDQQTISYTFPVAPYHPLSAPQKSRNSIVEKVMKQQSTFPDLNTRMRNEQHERERRKREEEIRRKEEELVRQRRSKELEELLKRDAEQIRREEKEMKKKQEKQALAMERRKKVEKKLTESEIERALLKTHGPIIANLISKKNPWLLHKSRSGPEPPSKEDWKVLAGWAAKKVVAAEMKKKGEYYCNLRKVPEKGSPAYIKMENYVAETLNKGRKWILHKITELKAEKATHEANANQTHPHSSAPNGTPGSGISDHSPAVAVGSADSHVKRAREEEDDTNEDSRSPKRRATSEEAQNSGTNPSVDQIMTDVSQIHQSYTESHTTMTTDETESTNTLVQQDATVVTTITAVVNSENLDDTCLPRAH